VNSQELVQAIVHSSIKKGKHAHSVEHCLKKSVKRKRLEPSL